MIGYDAARAAEQGERSRGVAAVDDSARGPREWAAAENCEASMQKTGGAALCCVWIKTPARGGQKKIDTPTAFTKGAHRVRADVAPFGLRDKKTSQETIGKPGVVESTDKRSVVYPRVNNLPKKHRTTFKFSETPPHTDGLWEEVCNTFHF